MLEAAPEADLIRAEPPSAQVARTETHVEESAPARDAPALPRIALELPADSGLVLVETTHVASPPEEGAEAPRPRRVRPARVAIADEPLQMVETTHKDSTPPATE